MIDRHYFTDKITSYPDTNTRADMMAHATGSWMGQPPTKPVLCDNPGCVSWGRCPHSEPHERIQRLDSLTYRRSVGNDGKEYPLVNVVCGTCCHDLNATCQRVEEK